MYAFKLEAALKVNVWSCGHQKIEGFVHIKAANEGVPKKKLFRKSIAL